MDFRLTLENILTAFREKNIQYALIGGFAMGLYGVSRATVDIDMLVLRQDADKVEDVMRGLGYECRYRSENVSQYISPLKLFGEVDFLFAFREASLEMLRRAEEKEIFGESIKIKTARAEDLIGLKVQALKNNPARKEQEISDIKALLASHKDIEWDQVQWYFEIFGLESLYEEIEKEMR